MWKELAELIIEKVGLMNSPKKTISRDVIQLYNDIEKCNLSFHIYSENQNKDNLELWCKSIEELFQSFLSLEKTVKIFDAELFVLLSYYCWEEFFLYSVRSNGDNYVGYDLEIQLKSYLTSMELALEVTKKANFELLTDSKQKQLVIETINCYRELSVEEKITLSGESFSDYRQKSLQNFYDLMSISGVDDHEIIRKNCSRPLLENNLSMDLALEKLRSWIRTFFKPEDLHGFIKKL